MRISRGQLRKLINEEISLYFETKGGAGDTDDYLSVAAPAVQLSKSDQEKMIRSSMSQLQDDLTSGECNPSDKSGKCNSDQAQLAALQSKEEEVAGA